MRIHLEKGGIRAAGVAESFKKSHSRSVLCAVVMRSDLVIDGCLFGSATLGGDDATGSIISIFKRFRRNDINVIMILGSVISVYNIVDGDRIWKETRVPTVCVTFEESKGLEEHIRAKFPLGWERKLTAYRKVAKRSRVRLANGYHLFLRPSGLALRDATKVMDKFTFQGALPEPLRVARLIARAKVFER